MKLYEFLILPDNLQYQAIWDHGQHIETRKVDDFVYQLYAISAFYVEIRYDLNTNGIAGKTAFKYGEILEKYLKQFPNYF